MKNISKLAVLGAVLAVSSSFALADTVTFASSSATVNYTGSILASSGFGTNPNTFASNVSPVAAANVLPAGVWAGPIAGTSWVSNVSTAGPGGGTIDPNGYYTFTDSFTALGGAYTGSFNIYADDTVAVYLGAPSSINSGSTPLILAGVIGLDTHCADNKPTCLTLDTISPFNVNLANGSNTLTFIVEQTGLAPMGVDFSGSLTQNPVPGVPEPSSLMMLGTGLMSAAGMLVRRRRQTV